ncbi:MAG: hypothetical protein Kow0098_27480 [Ignavibacteriaceae bacterium]
MNKISNKKDNIFELEALRSDLIASTLNSISIYNRIYLYKNYFNRILSQPNLKIEEAFIREFLEDYLLTIKKFEVQGIDPEISSEIITQLKTVTCLPFSSNELQELKIELVRLTKELETLNLILDGNNLSNGFNGKNFFPLIDSEAPTGFYGIIEFVTVRINKGLDQNRFIIIPSEKEIEKRIENQISNSWKVALSLLKNYVRKPYKSHEVIIHFDKRLGFYKGNSLGTSLTLSFLEQLLKFYNPVYVINIKEQCAFTGGVDENGKILPTGKENIKLKVNTVFYSEINSFVIPNTEESFANQELANLKSRYPNRRIKLISAEDIDDVINRRDLIDIRKQKLSVRTVKSIKKNWIPLSLALIIIGLIYYANLWDWDTNPSLLKNEKDWLYVQNKNGKLLWKKKMGFDIMDKNFVNMPYITQKIVDIDNDGINEVILAREARNNNELNMPNGRITCYSHNGDVIWENHFNDEVRTKEMIHSKDYFAMLIDTVTINKTKSLLCFAHNVLYPGAVYFIDIKNGNRIGSTLWNYGHLHSGRVGDFNRDHENELVMFGLNNAFKRTVVFSIDIDKIDGQLPTDEQKGFIDIKPAEFNKYVLLPNTDYNQFLTGNYNSVLWGYFLLNQDSTRIINFLMEGKASDLKGIMIELNGDLELTKIDLSLEFQIARDSLVSKGILSLPYTHTEEYRKVLWDQIEYLGEVHD